MMTIEIKIKSINTKEDEGVQIGFKKEPNGTPTEKEVAVAAMIHTAVNTALRIICCTADEVSSVHSELTDEEAIARRLFDNLGQD